MAAQMSLNENMPDKQNQNSGTTEHHRCCPHLKYINAQEYAQSLRPWLWQYQNACIMQNLASCLAMLLPPPTFPPVMANPNILQNNAQPEPQPLQGSAYKVPPFWKRMVAELVDFIILFLYKMAMTLFLMKVQKELSFYQLSTFKADDFQDNFNELVCNCNTGFVISYKVIALDVMNMILITIYETSCLYSPEGFGATFGKMLFGLKVVSCDQVQNLGLGQILVSPATCPISFKKALLRSALKHFTIVFFLPISVTLFFFKHNRAAYDIVAHTIVVEEL